ncbi:MAG: Rossmann-like domain-containing protein, partial [Desulfobacterales bacterium]
EEMEHYNALKPQDFTGKGPRGFALEFGSDDPIKEMISLAAINAICQHVMRVTSFEVDSATDSHGLLSISAGDRIGMVGLFFGLTKTIRKTGAELVVIEKKEQLIQKYPDLPITLDVTKLSTCNKILCTSTTILNHSLDEVLTHCSPDAFVSIIGPSAGYFPDPLFARGVDVVAGRVVKNGARFLQLLSERKRWGDATQRTCFQKKTYAGIIQRLQKDRNRRSDG